MALVNLYLVNSLTESSFHLCQLEVCGREPGAIPITGGTVAVGHAVADDAIGHFDVVDAYTAPSMSALAVGLGDALHLTRQGTVVLHTDHSFQPNLTTTIGIDGEGSREALTLAVESIHFGTFAIGAHGSFETIDARSDAHGALNGIEHVGMLGESVDVLL